MGVDVAPVVTDDGIRLAYEDTGRRDAPPMVLLHALGERAGHWAPVVARFAERFRVIAVDLRGHGSSDWPGQYSFQLMADDVLAVLDQLGLDTVTVVGHSMGGVVAYRLAIHHPERIKHLIVEDVPPPFPRDRALPERPTGFLEFDWAVVPAIVGLVNAGDPATWDRLETITAATLLIGGGRDSHIPQETLTAVAARIPGCRLATIPAGHNVHTVQPERFADTVLDWLGSS